MKLLLLISALLLSLPATGQDLPPSILRTTLNTPAPIWNGQRVELAIDLVAPGYFSGSPVFELPSSPDMLIVPPAGSPVVGSEDISGRSYITQRHLVSLYPRRPGNFELPAFTIRFAIKPDPLARDPLPQSVRTTAIRLEAKQPPGLPADGMTLTSADLTVEESWKPVPGKDAKPGDAYVRTITWKASDVTGIAFPPFPDDMAGPLALYRADPQVEDQNSRGGFIGGRTDVLTYVCRSGGNASIPALAFRWWDPVANEIRRVDFPAHEIHIVAPPIPPEPPLRRAWNFLHHHAVPIAVTLGIIAIFSATAYLARRYIAGFFRLLRPTHLPPLNPSGPP